VISLFKNTQMNKMGAMDKYTFHNSISIQ